MKERQKFLIVDDHPIFRHGLKTLIESEPRYEVYAEAGSTAEALEIIEREIPDIILLDISLGSLNGLELLKALRSSYPSVLTLIVSMHNEAVYAERALRAAARGYIMKDEASAVLLTAISEILAGRIFVSDSYKERLLEDAYKAPDELPRADGAQFSDRELEVVKYMGQGFGPTEIACMIGLAAKTVGFHQAHIKRKLSLNSISELRKFAIRWVKGA